MSSLIPFSGYGHFNPWAGLVGLDSIAVRQQTSQQAQHHREVMGALRNLSKETITVAVLSSAVLPLCNQALAKLEGPAADYDAAERKWTDRVIRVDRWLRKRVEREHRNQRRAVAAKRLAIARTTFRAQMRFWKDPWQVRREANKLARERCYYAEHRSLYRYNSGLGLRLDRRHAASRPRAPEGYADLPAIRDLRDAASISPDAQLTVPVGTVKKLSRWAA